MTTALMPSQSNLAQPLTATSGRLVKVQMATVRGVVMTVVVFRGGKPPRPGWIQYSTFNIARWTEGWVWRGEFPSAQDYKDYPV